jgi:hypothetical protein
MAGSDDKHLGSDRAITRRDFVNGVALGVGGALTSRGLPDGLVAMLRAEEASQSAAGAYYPPTRTGMRGSHDGSWEVSHSLRDGRFGQALGTPTDTRETYDLVVVGGGISGLAAAHFFRARAGRDARVLVLDNHDDFGGHAKRNEFHIAGRTLLMNGGTAGIDSPTPYSATADGLLKSLGVDAAALAARFSPRGAARGCRRPACAARISSTRRRSAPTSWSSAVLAVDAAGGARPTPTATRSWRRHRSRRRRSATGPASNSTRRSTTFPACHPRTRNRSWRK